MSWKQWMKQFTPARMLYYGLKEAELQRHSQKLQPFIETIRENKQWKKRLPYQLRDQYLFQNRQKGHKKMCMVLAGYKPELWGRVFQRIRRFLPEDIDMCIMTSGRKCPELMRICEQWGWSYLATRQNKLTRIQNLAIYLHPKAEYIYKLDEDIFVTAGFFDGLYETYLHAKEDLSYDIAFAAPLIPINGYGYVRVLERTGLKNDWEKKFGPAIYTDGTHHHTAILEQSEAARYMWGETQSVLRDIDALAASLAKESPIYTICPIRFSIGAILFTKEAWLDWGLFPVDWTVGLGLDEECVARYCMFYGKAAIVSEYVFAGHLGYGPQTKDMMSYFLSGKMCI